MTVRSLRRIKAAFRHIPSLLQGYNLHVNPDKLRLVEHTLESVFPSARSFADLGGIWRVNAAYSVHTLKRSPRIRGIVVDTEIPPHVETSLRHEPRLRLLKGDFGNTSTAQSVGETDLVYLFDVLLHQANPDWDAVLALYAKQTRCLVIYNQQYVAGDRTVRLTLLPLEEYMAITGGNRAEFFQYVFEHREEIHPVYGKPWGDIHNLTQWGITDADLRAAMSGLGFREVYFRNHGSFVGLSSLENHAFIFMRR